MMIEPKKGINLQSELNCFQKRRYKATLVIRSVEPTPLDLSHSKEAMLNYIACILLTLPALLHYSHYFGEIAVPADDNLQTLMEASLKDRYVLWTHLLVLINGAFAPVLHLLSDDVLCGFGLEILNKICDTLSSLGGKFEIGDVTPKSSSKESKGIDNVAFDEKEEEEEEKENENE